MTWFGAGAGLGTGLGAGKAAGKVVGGLLSGTPTQRGLDPIGVVCVIIVGCLWLLKWMALVGPIIVGIMYLADSP